MNPSDAVLWEMERDPVLRSPTLAVALLDTTPEWSRVVQRTRQAVAAVPRLRQRVAERPLALEAPRWVDDPHVELDHHLRRVRLPAGGGLRAVLDLAEPLVMAPFDRARPLWEQLIVEGLDGGGAALVQKLHHSLTDGVGAVDLALAMLDLQRRPASAGKGRPAPADGAASGGARPWLDQVREVALSRFEALVGGAWDASEAVTRTWIKAVTDPVGSMRDSAEMAASLSRVLAPASASASPLLQGRSGVRRLSTLEYALADLARAGHTVGGTVNDALLAAVVEGVRRYHLELDTDVDELRITMPVNRREDGDDPGGNRLTRARFVVPATIDDAADRMRVLGSLARSARAEPALEWTDALAAVFQLLPGPVATGVLGPMFKQVDVAVSNVPGLPVRTFLAGAELVRAYAFGPPTGAAVNVALLSHLDTACIGVVTDPAAVADEALLLGCLEASFDDVVAAGGAAR
jgi:diacylglycerol O-acyltransferase